VPIGVPRRPSTKQANSPASLNWRRGLFWFWLLVSIGWIMSWVNYLLINCLEGRLLSSDALTIPIVLFAPPAALLIFGIAARWAILGFRINRHSAATLVPTAVGDGWSAPTDEGRQSATPIISIVKF